MPLTNRNSRNSEAFGRNPVTYTPFTQSNQLVLPGCFFGVEMELENCASMAAVEQAISASRQRPGFSDIATHRDDSLRNGVELVFGRPLLGEQAINAIDAMYSLRRDFGLQGSIRTSTHVHINYVDTNDTVTDVQRTTLLYLLLEKAMALACREHREWNTFCQPSYFAPADVESSYYAVATASNAGDVRAWIQRASEASRYFSLNLQALYKYGTIEYRMLGTVDRPQFMLWINTLMAIKRVAADDSIPYEQLLSYETLQDLVNAMPTQVNECVVVNDESEAQYQSARRRMRRGAGLRGSTTAARTAEGVDDVLNYSLDAVRRLYENTPVTAPPAGRTIRFRPPNEFVTSSVPLPGWIEHERINENAADPEPTSTYEDDDSAFP